jgi:hypothetical protein
MSLSSLGALVSCHRGQQQIGGSGSTAGAGQPTPEATYHQQTTRRGCRSRPEPFGAQTGVICYRHETTGGLHFVSDRSGGFRCALARVETVFRRVAS